MINKSLFFLCFGIISSQAFGQITLQKMCHQVLLENKIDTSYSFSESNTTDGYAKTTLKYLGSVKTTKKSIFKILTYEFVWGINKHTSGSIFIFNKKNKYVGKYVLGDSKDLPDQLKNNNLIFTNTDNDNCNKGLTTKINLYKGLPKKIFIKCNGIYGDLYYFSTND